MSIARYFVLAFIAFVTAAAAAQALTPHEQLTRDIYKELVEIRTVHPDGDNTAAARAMAKRLIDAGFDPKDVEVIEPHPLKGNVVARLRGTGELKPLLLLAHLDVVEAKKEDWSDGLDPFKLTERDGYFYGRGVIDDKAMAAIFIANLAKAKREGWKPKRDIIVALTADEETGGHNGVAWLLKNRPELIAAEVALNEGGGGQYRRGKPFVLNVQVSEKMYLTFDFEVTHAGGHSSTPGRENAIYELAAALDRLSRFDLPARPNMMMRRMAAKLVDVETGDLAKAFGAVAEGRATDDDYKVISRVPRYNAQLRTTCVATRIEGGHGDNALPQRAKAAVNCRLLPGEDPEFVRSELQRVAGDKVTVTPRGSARKSDPSDPESPWIQTIARISAETWPTATVVPVMSAGATDGSRLRNAGYAVYGVSGIFTELGENRLHGKDERVGVRSFFDATGFLDRLVRALGSGT
ncbi:Acetylornithine deacetylase [Usitatibacter rugosus]|uniref:Acetylornithine deacetylase n=1 Tax=Usitatibacter rugosus TaxID=2732067 RepID=A0A6M4H0G3_9PROT|nr:M20/M25/M40 family metallo-hydrolase [Usitatibacter rugosus]QJR12815.1 Acetylornithine deacetylase [Usitatibacter rugosus]